MTSKNQVLQCSGKEERMHAEMDKFIWDNYKVG